MDCSPPGSPVHGILQARILDWVAISSSSESSHIQRSNPGFLHGKQILYYLSQQGSPRRETPYKICVPASPSPVPIPTPAL